MEPREDQRLSVEIHTFQTRSVSSSGYSGDIRFEDCDLLALRGPELRVHTAANLHRIECIAAVPALRTLLATAPASRILV